MGVSTYQLALMQLLLTLVDQKQVKRGSSTNLTFIIAIGKRRRAEVPEEVDR